MYVDVYLGRDGEGWRTIRRRLGSAMRPFLFQSGLVGYNAAVQVRGLAKQITSVEQA